MAILGQVITRIRECMFPSRSAQRRGQDTSHQRPLKQQLSGLNHDQISKTVRTVEWINRPLPSPTNIYLSSQGTPKVLKVKGGRITKLSMTPPSSTRKSARSWRFWTGPSSSSKVHQTEVGHVQPEEGELDGPTLVEDDEDITDDAEGDEYLQEKNTSEDYDSEEYDRTLVEPRSRPQSQEVKKYKVEYSTSDDEDEPSPTAAKADAKSIIPTLAEEHKMREAALKKLVESRWTDSESALYRKIKMRGFEPLLPHVWVHDFVWFPVGLFAKKGKDSFINSVSGQDFRAMKAFYFLMFLGARVRAKKEIGSPPESLIKREIRKYIKWSHQDAALDKKKCIPNIAMTVHKPGQDSVDVEEDITRKLRKLGDQYRDAFRIHQPVEKNKRNDEVMSDPDSEAEQYSKPLPTLYGIVIVGTVVAIATFNSADPWRRVRSVGMFNLAKNGLDVWTTFAFGVLVTQARDELMVLREGMGSDEVESDDPDA